jgi:hypothetical protein
MMVLLQSVGAGLFAAAQYVACLLVFFAGAVLLFEARPTYRGDWSGWYVALAGITVCLIAVGMLYLVYVGDT